MAEKHFTQRNAGSSARPPAARKRPAKGRRTPSSATSSRGSSRRPAKANSTTQSRDLASSLRDIASALNTVYSTCVTAQLALKGQNADQDYDILAALRMNVTEPVSRQVERLNSIAQSLAGDTREACP
jgi:hypothetical protein